MNYGDLLKEAGFVREPLLTDANKRAVAAATERYVAECGPSFLFDLYQKAYEFFDLQSYNASCFFEPKNFEGHETLRTASLVDVLRRIYPDMTRIRPRRGFIDSPRSDAWGMQLVYAGAEEDLNEWVRGKSSRQEVVEVRFELTD